MEGIGAGTHRVIKEHKRLCSWHGNLLSSGSLAIFLSPLCSLAGDRQVMGKPLNMSRNYLMGVENSKDSFEKASVHNCLDACDCLC